MRDGRPTRSWIEFGRVAIVRVNLARGGDFELNLLDVSPMLRFHVELAPFDIHPDARRALEGH